MPILLQAMLAAVTALPDATPLPPAPTETLSVASDFTARMTLPTQVNGRGPYRFLIDTGADHSVVSDQLARDLSLELRETAIVYGIQGPQPFATVALEALRIGRREHHALTAPVLPHTALGAQGLIGLDALANESVLFDFKRNEVTIAQSAHEAMVGDPDTITVLGKSRFGQLILTDAAVKGVKVYAIIDTGAENTIGNLALRKLMGRAGPLDNHGERIVGATGASLPAEAGTVPRIRLGKLELGNMAIAYCDVATFRKFGVGDKPAILIGMDVLRGFERVAVDFRRRAVRFKVNEDGTAQAS